MVAYTYNPNAQKAEAEGLRFKFSLGYAVRLIQKKI
jgi:hypothetical protein